MSKVKLDKWDKEILKALEEDGRALIKDISKKTGIPRDSVNYRLKRMRSEGVITKIVPVCDTVKMGYPLYTYIFLELQQFDSDIEKKFVSFLKGHRNSVYIARLTGNYHYLLAMATKDIREQDEIIRSIVSKFPNFIKNYHTALLIEETQYDTFHKLIGVK